MSNEQNVPKVRFSGFSGTWEIRELSELAEIVRGASPRPIDDPKWFDKNSKVGWLRIRDVTEQNGRIHHLGQRISKEGEGKTRVLHDPHLLLSIAASVGKPVINYVSTGVHDGFLIFRKPSFDMEFMYQWLKSFELKWQQYGQPGSQVNLNSDIVKLQAVSLPCRDEQEFVGNYFKKLDTLINQHQEKYEKLCNLKKAMLEKMFPKAGETVPEIRFDGFSSEWFEVQLGETARIKGRLGWKSLKQNEYISSGPAMIAGKHIKNGRIDWSKVDHIPEWRYLESPEIMLKNDDVIFSKDGSLGNPVVVENLQGKATINSTMMLVRPSDNLDSNYFYQVLNTKIFKDLIKEKVSGSSIPHLFQADMKQFKFYCTSLEEQYQIGVYFKRFDTLIEQHQQQITKLKNIKQACLDKMFV
ncbi:restriction endonuclease subunit S [Photobacterium damselae]